jgi:peptide-methionine (S)-S-oxide reductase
MFRFGRDKSLMVTADQALTGRTTPMQLTEPHHVFRKPLSTTLESDQSAIIVGMGCFWGAERKFWSMPGVVNTCVGYTGGFTPNPTYEEVCSGLTGHNEVVHIIFNPNLVSVEEILSTFWNHHNPTQGMRQGNDTGTQYRSGIYYVDSDHVEISKQQKAAFEGDLQAAGHPKITTEILPAQSFYFAESYHQQYLSKNPNGYCGLGGTGVSCPISLGIPFNQD